MTSSAGGMNSHEEDREQGEKKMKKTLSNVFSSIVSIWATRRRELVVSLTPPPPNRLASNCTIHWQWRIRIEAVFFLNRFFSGIFFTFFFRNCVPPAHGHPPTLVQLLSWFFLFPCRRPRPVKRKRKKNGSLKKPHRFQQKKPTRDSYRFQGATKMRRISIKGTRVQPGGKKRIRNTHTHKHTHKLDSKMDRQVW